MKRGIHGRLGTFAICCWTVIGVWVAAETAQPAAPFPQAPQGPQTTTAGSRCRVEGHVKSGNVPLPGASVVVQVGDTVKAATSTDADGKFTIAFSPNATYRIVAELTAFARAEHDLTLGAPPCDTTVDFALSLRSRREAANQPQAPAPGAARGNTATQPSQPGQVAAPPPQPGDVPASNTPAAGQRARGGRGRGGAGAPAAGAGQRFQTLAVEADATGAAALEAAPPDDGGDVARLLPPGFSADTAQADAIAINGSGDATNLDRGSLNGRQQAIRLGQFDPDTGQFAQGFGPGGQGFGPPADGGFGGRGGGGGGGRGGGGRGGFQLLGRGARGQSPYQGSMTYTFGGSALNTPPYQLRQDVADHNRFSQNGFGGTFSGR